MEYEIANEYKQVAKRLFEKYPTQFEGFDIEKILFLKETGKKPKKFADIRKVRPPYSFVMEQKFIITFYEKCMQELSDAQKHLVVMHELLHIGPDFDSLVKHDVQDFAILVAKYSPTWTTNPNIPDILAE